jgi:anti-sigma factor RsiW
LRATRARRVSRRAVFASAAAAVALLAVGLWPRGSQDGVEAAVFSAHVRSLLADHLTDIASSDQHTVKPWFQGKLDYSIPATDFAAQGFPLVGGRLDYVDDRPAAALVYRRGKHVVNLFTWPSKDGVDEPLRPVAQRGYRGYRFTRAGMTHWVVSDVNDADLRAFVALVQGDRG